MQSVKPAPIQVRESTAFKIKFWSCIALAVWMLIGGLQGLWIIRGGWAHLFDSPTTFFVVGFYILFFAANVAAAWMLWKTPQRGLKLTFVLQLAALIRFQGPQIKHVLASLYGVWLAQTENGLGFLFNRGSCFAFSHEYSSSRSFAGTVTTSIFDGPIYFGVNLVAIAIGTIAWILWKTTKASSLSQKDAIVLAE